VSDVVKVIPCLDIKEGRVVKGIKFVNLRDARDPVEAAVSYCRQGADELVFLDIVATLENRSTRLEWVKKVAEKATVPFAVGGGIRNTADMQALFDMGVDKVSINTAAVRNPELIKEASQKFGKNKLVVAIDGKKNPSGGNLPRLEVVVSGGEEATGMDIVEWAKKVEELGAGEILLTSNDADGTKEDYAIELSERAVRYHLRLLDERGLTSKVSRRDGRVITEQGVEELKNAMVADKVGFVIDKIELLAYQTTFDPVKRSGKVPGNMEIFPKEQFRAALIAMADVFSSKMCASSLVPVGRNKVGVVLIGGLNPPAAAAEAGIDVTNMAMSRLIDFERLQSFWEL